MGKLYSLKERKGFTLIELLVVIVIISILATLLMVNLVSVRQRGRDTQRKSDLRQIQAALELYRADNGVYAALPSCGGALVSGSTTYMQKVPCDPLSGASYSFYTDSPTNSIYCIRACLENTADSQRDSTNNAVVGSCSLSNCSASTTSFTVQNP